MRMLLAVDGSSESYAAAHALAHLARSEKLIVLHVLDLPMNSDFLIPPETASELRTKMEESMRDEGERLLKEIAAMLPRDSGTVSTRIETASPAAVIMNVAEEEHIDLMVLGMRGKGPLHELVLGSVSQRVLTHSGCPTLVVNTPVRALDRVLLPLQGTVDAQAAVTFLARHPFRKSVEITVLTVLPFGAPLWDSVLSGADSFKEKAAKGAQTFVDEVVEELRRLNYRAKGITRLGFPSAEIIHESIASDTHLILMGSCARRGLNRFLIGSVAHAVVHRSTRPILVFR